jgi:hypothetical protein
VRRLGALLLAGLLSLCAACEKEKPSPPDDSKEALPEPLVPLTAAFLTRATGALQSRLDSQDQILEIRATGRSFSVQLLAKKNYPASDKSKAVKAGSLIQLDYIERPTEIVQPPIGRIYGPQPVPSLGQGDLEGNLYPYEEISLSKMARAFPIALLAVDPEDGKVARLVVRRYLPFSFRIRGRIFVDSPRMGGSIDVNEQGVPLKR